MVFNLFRFWGILFVMVSIFKLVDMKKQSYLDSITLSFILVLKLLGFVDHPFDVVLGQSALVVGDGDLVLLASRLVHSGHV